MPSRYLCFMTDKVDAIYLADVLRLLDETQMPDGTPIYHSIAFITYDPNRPADNGRLVRIDKARKVGLKGNVKDLQRRGLQDSQGNIRNCHIRLIVEFDQKRVIW